MSGNFSVMEAPFAQQKIKDFFSSRFGFIISATGSAVGLGNIWKFPYIVGKFGGASFLLIYFFFLVLLGFPTFLAEVSIGKATGLRPQEAFQKLGKNRVFGLMGLMTVWTGFLISSFYSVVAAWILGYFFEALSGRLQGLHTTALAHGYYTSLMQNPLFGSSYHLIFALFCAAFLLGGIKKGIERCNKIFMPVFLLILSGLAVWALCLPSSSKVVSFMTSVEPTAFPSTMLLVALGHAFFTLSIGQGTLVTYGSYVKSKEGLLTNAIYIVIADTLISLLAAFTVISIVFYADTELTFGPGLIFETLPAIFSDMAYGHILCPLFFFLIFIAALTSQISALEPLIAHLEAHHRISRKGAVLTVVLGSFILGIPSSLSTSLLSDFQLGGQTVLDVMNFITTSILVPLGGLFAIILVGRKWGVAHLVKEITYDLQPHSFLRRYLTITLQYIAPVLVFVVFLHAVGWL